MTTIEKIVNSIQRCINYTYAVPKEVVLQENLLIVGVIQPQQIVPVVGLYILNSGELMTEIYVAMTP